MATGARGEATLVAGGQEYPILFTNRALAQAEKVIGKPMLELLSAIHENKLSIGDTAHLLAIGIEFGRRDAKAGGRAYLLEDAWRIMDELGFTTIVALVIEAVAAVLAYDGDKSADPPA